MVNAQDAHRAVELWVPCETWTWNAQTGKMHRLDRARKVKSVRESAKYAALNWINGGGRRFDEPVVVTFRPVQGAGQLADTANHGPVCKAALDGFVDARLVPQDTPEWVLSQTYLPPLRAKQTGVWVAVAIPDGPLPMLPAHRSAG